MQTQDTERPRVCPLCGAPITARSPRLAAMKTYCSKRCANASRRVPVAERFWTHVQKTDSCWLWTGTRNTTTGYGYAKVGKGRVRDAHRIAYELTRGEIPPGLCVCHTCDVRHCVRPDHLWLGTKADNLADMARKGRAASGDRNGSRLHPERMMRGEERSLIMRARAARGDNHGHARLTTADVLAIKQLLAAGTMQQKVLAARFKVRQATISDIATGKTWKHVPCPEAKYSAAEPL